MQGWPTIHKMRYALQELLKDRKGELGDGGDWFALIDTISNECQIIENEVLGKGKRCVSDWGGGRAFVRVAHEHACLCMACGL